MEGRFVGRASVLDDQINLLDVVLTGEHNTTRHDLAKSASSRPNVHFVIVLVAGEHDFGGAVVPCDHVLRQILIPLQAQVAAQSEVTVNY